jgi:hypothetical protein
MEKASPNSIFWGLSDGAGRASIAASLASLESSLLTLISSKRRMRAIPTNPATTKVSVLCRLKLPSS